MLIGGCNCRCEVGHQSVDKTGSPPPTIAMSPATTPSSPTSPATVVVNLEPGPSTSSATAATMSLRVDAGMTETAGFLGTIDWPSTETAKHDVRSTAATTS